MRTASENTFHHVAEPSAIALLILGMHRSGTSALAGLLHTLGLAMGNNFVDTEAQHNAKGYWENLDANNFNDELLAALRSNWFDPFNLPEKLASTVHQDFWDRRLSELIVKNFGGHDVWAVKDPRLCRLLPFWQRTLVQVKMEAKFLLILRHPIEVFESLNARNGIEQPLAALLWLRYVLDSIGHSYRHQRTIITYSDLLEDWYGTLRKVECDLGICLNLDNKNAVKKAAQFIEKGLKHHSVSDTLDCHTLMQLAIDCHDAIVNGNLKNLSAISASVEEQLVEHRLWILQSNRLLTDQAELQLHKLRYERLLHEHRMLYHDYEGVTASVSWRITKPLRYIKRQLRGHS